MKPDPISMIQINLSHVLLKKPLARIDDPSEGYSVYTLTKSDYINGRT
jgi:hypothetical protein